MLEKILFASFVIMIVLNTFMGYSIPWYVVCIPVFIYVATGVVYFVLMRKLKRLQGKR